MLAAMPELKARLQSFPPHPLLNGIMPNEFPGQFTLIQSPDFPVRAEPDEGRMSLQSSLTG